MKRTLKKIITGIISWESRLVIRKYKPKIVAVTGSVGKTSTKDAIYTVLASRFSARKSEKSLNSEIGVPLSVLGQKNARNNPFLWLKNIIDGFLLVVLPYTYPAWLVLEIGTDQPGDIKSVARWLRPDIVVLTSFGDVPVHIEFFPSIDDLIREKMYLAKALKGSGLLVYNRDDKKVEAAAETISQKKISYGFEPSADITASHDEIIYAPYEDSNLKFPAGISFKVAHAGSTIPFELQGALGRQHVFPLLAAVAVGISQGMNPVELDQALKVHRPPKGRMALMPGINETVIIDDTYNSSPVAVVAALRTLYWTKALGRKIAVLGDMLELGRYSVTEHERMGEQVIGIADILVTVGIRSRGAAEAALDKGMDEAQILQFDSSTEAGRYLADNFLKRGDIVLVKGSQAMRMERVVEEIMEHRESKENLLVRQDKHWLARK